MLQKTLNKISAAAFNELMQDKNIIWNNNQAVKDFYKISQAGIETTITDLTKTQINDNFLRNHNFDPGKCIIKKVLTVNRQTKQVVYLNN
jgi:hypothetical protein